MKKILAIILCLAFSAGMVQLVNSDRPLSQTAHYFLENAINDTNSPNVISAIMFDYRGFDTFLEIMVLFAVSAGIAAMFAKVDFPLSSQGLDPVIKTLVNWHLPFIFVFSFYLPFYGRMSPGGGFQGGVMLASTTILVSVVYGIGHKRGLLSQRIEHALEVCGSLGFILIGASSIIFGANFLSNQIAGYNMGITGNIFSSGTILWLDLASGLHVAGSLGYIFYVMLKSRFEK